MNKIATLVLFSALALVVVGCSGDSTEVGQATPTVLEGVEATARPGPKAAAPASYGLARVIPTSLGPEDSRLRVKLGWLDADSVPILNGGIVDFGDGLMAELFVDPYPTNTLTSWVDLYLTDSATGEPVDDAHVIMEYDMWSMAHGPYIGFADSSANGHYVFRLDYIMFGAWEQVLEIRSRGSDDLHRLVVLIVAFP
jgi:hypothetical protein